MAGLSEFDHLFMIYRVWVLCFATPSLDSEVGMMYLADCVKWFWHRVCCIRRMYRPQFKAQGWDPKAQVTLSAAVGQAEGPVQLVKKYSAAVGQAESSIMAAGHAQCWASLVFCMG
ncbi:hypothetical protein Hanom_Chr14g01245801 [Helianthus anomalus]